MSDTTTGSAPTGELTGWRVSSFDASGIRHDVYEKGAGPGVVVIPEVPGMTPEVIGFAEHLVASGFTVVLPSVFGEPGRPASGGYLASVMPRLCVSREFRAFAGEEHRPLTDFLRALAADLASRTPGRGVGVVGMCFTGGFALAAAVDDVVRAAVASQPGVPIRLGSKPPVSAPMSADELSRLTARAERGDVCALGLRFSEDRIVPAERFASLKRRLGDAFEVIELDSSPGNPDGYRGSAHSVLTTEVRTDPPNSASRARDRVAEFLTDRLRPEPAE